METSDLLRSCGRSCIATGVIGAAAALFLIVVDPVVSETRYSYPLSTSGFVAIQLFFFVHHIGLIAGLYGLWRSGAVGTSRLGRAGAVGAMAGMTLLTVAELVAISGADSAYPSPRTDGIDALYGIASMTIGVTLVMAGIAVVRAKLWDDWRRHVPLVLGVYVFVPMTPAMVGPFVAARLAIGGWMVGFAVLGWALTTTADGVGGSIATRRSATAAAG